MQFEHFSSLPPEEERMFMPFEERMRNVESFASKIGWIIAGALAAIILVVVFSFPPPPAHTGDEGAAEPAASAKH